MSDGVLLFILNQGWRLGIVVLCVILMREVLKRVTSRSVSYLLWCVIPICYFYIMVVNATHVFYYRVVVKPNILPYVLLSKSQVTGLKVVFGIGIAVMLLYAVHSYIKTKYYMKDSIHFMDNIYFTERSGVPFTIGIFKPKIYLPLGMKEEFYEPVTCHEKIHIVRKDYVTKNIAFILLSLNWFQPLMWIAFYLFIKDMEVSCDEAVLRKKSMSFRKRYAEALLELSARRASVGTVEYGNGELKERIKNISRNRKEKNNHRILMIAMCVAIIICSIPAYWYIHKPFGMVPDSMAATDVVWEVKTKIYP